MSQEAKRFQRDGFYVRQYTIAIEDMEDFE